MSNFIFLSDWSRLGLSILYLLVFITQLFLVAMTNFSYRRYRYRIPEYILLLLHGILTFFIFFYMQYARWGIIIEVPWFFRSSLCLIYPVVFLIRGMRLTVKRKKTFNQMISPLTITSAINTLDSGLLVYHSDGRLVLINDTFVQLLETLFGKVYRNGFSIWESLLQFEPTKTISKKVLEDSIIIRLADHSFEITNQQIPVGRKSYYHILASNITLLDEKNRYLEKKEEELHLAVKKLESMEENLAQLAEEKEKIKIKIRLHNHLGQKLSMLQSYLHSSAQDPDLLEHLHLFGVIDDIRKDAEENPAKEIFQIIEFFQLLGIDITIIGGPPKDLHVNEVFSQIVKEALNNAVLHSNATKITILSLEDEKGYKLVIENNGHVPKGDIVEGGGIKGIRYRLSKLGGTLFIKTGNTFRLEVLLQKRKDEDSQ